MVTAKFRVTRLTPWGHATVVDGVVVPSPEDDGAVTAEVELTPDYAGGRNAAWSKATPNGVIRLTITNADALAHFKERQAFTVTFEEDDSE